MTDNSSAGLAEDVDKDKLISFWQKEKKAKLFQKRCDILGS